MDPANSAPALDLFTVKAMTLLTMLIVSGATLLAGRVNRRVAGMRLFAVGLVTIFAGGVFGIARLVIPGSLILIVCNVLMLGGMITVAQAIRRFRGFAPIPKVGIASLIAATGSGFFWFLVVHEAFGMRVGFISAAFCLLTSDAAVSMIRGAAARDRAVYWPTGFAFVFASIYLGARAFTAFSGGYGSSLLSPVPMELASTLCANVAYIGCAFGMLLSSNAQLRHDAEKLALYDPLTGLPNRRLLLERLLEAEHRAASTGRRIGVIYLDLDGFKQVNDTLGHEAGDEVLRRVSTAMIRVLRLEDCLARIGGDEFVAVVEGVEGRGEITILAERLKAAVESQFLPGESPVFMQVSCGAAVFPEDGLSAHDVMREADAAMYHAKRRNRLAGQQASA